MIVECILRITTDDGIPAVLSEGRRVVVQEAADFEGNLLKASALLGDLVHEGQEAVAVQIKAYRRAAPNLGLGPQP